jgi:hypothetical protein
MTINILRIALAFAFCLNLTVFAQTQNSEQKQFREIYQELVEINTTDSAVILRRLRVRWQHG